MKKMLSILVIVLFFLNGLTVLANEGVDSGLQEKPQQKLLIAPIMPLDFQKNHELKISTISYKLQSNNCVENRKTIDQYSLLETQTILQTYEYVIITSSNLYPAVTASSFLNWKHLIGFSVKIVNITDSIITSQTGFDLPQKIRNFLRSYYQSWGIEFVLIVGDHATIPMRYCYPDPTNHRFDIFDWTSGEVPTDYYYADLSSADADSWDFDNDGYYGEYGEDQPDFYPEVYVGRIPTNILSRITYTLDKIVRFEQDTGSWKHHALHAGAFFYFTNEDFSGNPAMDGAQLSHYIETDIMDGWMVSHYSEQQGLESSVYTWPALTLSSFITDWRTGQYAVVNWQGHGWTNRVARKVWPWDDGDGVPEANEIIWPDFININAYLDDDFPSIVTAESCYVGCPETASEGNLGIALLTDPSMGASIGVIASARSPYGSLDWPNNPGGSDSLIYEFNRFMINDSKRVGEALYDAKFFCNFHYGWDHYAEYLDLYTFNLYGDPSLILEGITVDNHPPTAPTINGPTHGQVGTTYQWTFLSSDPEGDDVTYYVDWGDVCGGAIYYGPYPSGLEVTLPHTYTFENNFVINALAIDEYGAESNWTSLEVIMPMNILYQDSFILRLLEWFPNAYPVIRRIIEILM